MDKLTDLGHRYLGAKNRQTQLEEEYHQKTKGPIYYAKKHQIERQIDFLKDKLFNIGLVQSIIEVRYSIEGIKYKTLLTGITPKEAEVATKLRNPNCTHIITRRIIPGTVKLQ